MQEIGTIDFPLYGADGNRKGTCGLPIWLFGGDVKKDLLHQVIVSYMSNRRQATVSTKNRSLVRGGGKKPWRQKGTGRARAGSIRSPLWKGGGVIFGPRDRNFKKKVTRKMRRLALISAFSARAGEGNVAVFELPDVEERPKTRVMFDVFTAMDLDEQNTLLLTNGKKDNVLKSCRNIPWVTVKTFRQANCLDVMKSTKILIDREVAEDDLGSGEDDGLSQDH
jgi:large subunit ribosomal protein L4